MGFAWGELGNGIVGDCECAMVGHYVQNAQRILFGNTYYNIARVSQDLTIDLYCRACGYQRGVPTSDGGCGTPEVMSWWRQWGIQCSADPFYYGGTLLTAANFVVGETVHTENYSWRSRLNLIDDAGNSRTDPKAQWSLSTSQGLQMALQPDGSAIFTPPGNTRATGQLTVKGSNGATYSAPLIVGPDQGRYQGYNSKGELGCSSFIMTPPIGAIITGDQSGAQFKIASYGGALPQWEKILGYSQNEVAITNVGRVPFGAPVNPNTVMDQLKFSIKNFGGACLAVGLPTAWQGQMTWDVSPTTPYAGNYAFASWGYHAIYALAYDTNYVYIVTWAQIVRVTWAAYLAYFHESWAVLLNAWVKANLAKIVAAGYSISTLMQMLNNISAVQ